MRLVRLLVPVGAAAVLALVGCSADADREPTAVEESIIERLAEPSNEDAAVDTEAERNEMVTACMAEEGLEYLGPAEAASQIEWLGLTDEEFGAKYGFGHTTTIDLAPAYQAFVVAEMEQHRAAFDALPEAERGQYSTVELECLQESYAALGFPENGSFSLPNDSPVHEYTERATEATAADPRLAAVTEAWSACMLEQGYDFGDRDEMGWPLQEEGSEFAQLYATQGQALVDAGQAWEDLSAAVVLDAEQLATLEALQQRELDTFAAHQYCIEQDHDIDAVYSQVYDEHLASLAEN